MAIYAILSDLFGWQAPSRAGLNEFPAGENGMAASNFLGKLFPGLFSSLPKDKKKKRPSTRLVLDQLEGRVVPATAVFSQATNTLTINLAANEAFDYFNEFRDSAQANALVQAPGYFKLSRWDGNANAFVASSWTSLTDASGTWVNLQVGDGASKDSIQLAGGKTIDGINIKVTGTSSWEGAYFRANPDKADGKFSGTLTVDATVDDSVVQDYNFYSKGDVFFNSPLVTAYADIVSEKNLSLTTAVGTSPVMYVDGSRILQAGGAGFTLTINSTIEGTTPGGGTNPLHRANIVNSGGLVQLNGGAGGNLPYTALDGLDVVAENIALKGAFYFAVDHMRFHAPVTIDNASDTVFSVENELLLEKGINSVNPAAPRGLAFAVNGGGVATINSLPGGVTPVFTKVDFRPVPGSEGALVKLGTDLQTTGASGITIKIPVNLTKDVTLKASSVVELQGTGTIDSDDPNLPSKLTVNTASFRVTGPMGATNPLASLSVVGGLKILASTSITTVGDILQSGSSANVQLYGRLTATSQTGNITLPNLFVHGDTTAKTGAINLSAPTGKLLLYSGATAIDLQDISLTGGTLISIAPDLSASGAGGIKLAGPITIAGDRTYTAAFAGAPLSIGTLNPDAAGRALTLVSNGGAVDLTGPVGQTTALQTLTVNGASSFTNAGGIKVDGTATLRADAFGIKGEIVAPNLTLTNVTKGKTLVLGADSGGDLNLDTGELANLKATTLSLGRSDANNSTGLVTVAGVATIPATATKVLLFAPEGVATTNNGGITTSLLTVNSGKSVLLTGANAIGTLSGGISLDLTLNNTGPTVLGSGSGSLTIGGAGNISSTGPITQANRLAVTGLLDLSATAGLGQEQDITLTDATNTFSSVRLGYAGDVKLAVANDLTLAQATVIEGGSPVPALVGSLTAASGNAGKLILGGNLDISGPISLTSGTAMALGGGTQIRSTAQSGSGIGIKGGLINQTGTNLTLDAGAGTLVADLIKLTGNLTIPSLGGTSSIGTLSAGTITVTKGTGNFDIGSPTANSLTVSGGSLNLNINAVTGVSALTALNTGTTTIKSATSTLNMPGGSTVNKLALGAGITTLNFPGGGTLISNFTVPSGVTLNIGDSAGDSLASGGSIVVASGGTVGGTGTLQGNLQVQKGGTYAPGPQTITGNLTLDALSTLKVDISGSTLTGGAGTLRVNGTATVTGALLDLTNNTGYLITKDQVFSALESGAGGTVTGNFSGLAEGGTLTDLSTSFSMDYGAGSSGRDIQMKALADSNTTPTAPIITSAASTTFTVGQAGSFQVVATGFPAATFSVSSGTLPTGVTLNTTTGLLSGTPAAGTGGVKQFTIQASNGVGTTASQSFTLTVNQAPAFTSANSTSFTTGLSNSFTLTASGFPGATFSLASGTLPTGVTLSAAGLLSGNPAEGTEGTYTVTFQASNGIGTAATQNFTLTLAAATTKPGVYAVASMGGSNFSTLRIYENGTNRFVREVIPFPGFKGEFYVDSGDISGDGVEDIIVGSGNGSPNGHVVMFDGARLLAANPTVPVELGYKAGGSVRASLYAFIGYSSGVAVRLGDLNKDGYDDIILAPGTGAGTVTVSHLRVWDGKLSMQQFENGDPFLSYNYAAWEMASFYAFGDDRNTGGGMSISVIRQQGTNPDLIVASQLFRGGSKVFQYDNVTKSKVLTTAIDFTGANAIFGSGNTVFGFDLPEGRFFVSAGTDRGAPNTVFVRKMDGPAQGTVVYTIPNVLGGTGGGLRLGMSDVNGDGLDELLVTRSFDSTTEVYTLGPTSATKIGILNNSGGGTGGWV